MIRVVLDSNVYVSALLFGGNPRLILEGVEAGLFAILISTPIQGEVERILAEKFHWPQQRIRASSLKLWRNSERVAPNKRVADCVDPDDNKILECALEGRAAAIVTGDSHLLKLHPYRGIPVLTPREFLEARPWGIEGRS